MESREKVLYTRERENHGVFSWKYDCRVAGENPAAYKMTQVILGLSETLPNSIKDQ